MNAIALSLALSLAPRAAAADAPAPALVFATEGRETLRVTAAELAKRPDARLIEVDDPYYGRRKRYRAVPLKSLFTAAFGGSWGENTLGEAFFEALDGYRSHAKLAVVMEPGAMLAFEDADLPDWEAIPGHGSDAPGPFYLVWLGAGQVRKNGFPWPWQIARIELGALEERYPKAVPQGVAPESAAARGWKLFRENCISCHAISGDGGRVGPDLNEPRGITRYHSKGHLKAYIRKASSFRHTKMPDFDELSSSELSDLMSYFDRMTRQAGTK